MALVANAYVRFHAQDTGVMRQIGTLDRGLNDLQRTFLKFASVTAAVTAFTGMIRGAIDFESALVGVRKTTDATTEQMARLKEEFKRTAAQTGITKKELANIGQVAGQLGIFAKGGEKGLASFTKTIAKSRIAMKEYAGSSEEAATTTAKLLNILNLEVDQAETLLSTINQLSNTTAAGSDDIAEFTRRIGGTASVLGATVPSIAALSATLTEVGVNAEMGGTAVSQMLIMMQKDTDKFAGVLGKNGAAFKKAFAEDPIIGLQMFAAELNKFDKASKINIMENLGINNARMIDTLLKLTGDKGIGSLAKTMDTANQAFSEGTSLQNEFNIASTSTATKLAKLWEVITNVGDSIGSFFLPIIGKLAEALSTGIEFAVRYSDAIWGIVAAMTALKVITLVQAGIAGVSTAMNVFSAAASGNITLVAGLIKGAGRLAPIMTMLNNAVITVMTAFGQGGLLGVLKLINPWFLAGIVVITAMIAAYKRSADVQKLVQRVMTGLKAVVSLLFDAVKSLTTGGLSPLGLAFEIVVRGVEVLAIGFNALIDLFAEAWRQTVFLTDEFLKAVGVTGGLDRVVRNLADAYRILADNAKAAWGWVKSFGETDEVKAAQASAKSAQEVADAMAARTAAMEAARGGGGGGEDPPPPVGGSGDDAKKKAEEAIKKLEEEQKKLTDMERDQFNLVKQKLEIEKKVLLEKKEQGELTKVEQDRLEKIDRYMQNLPENLFEANDRLKALVEGIDESHKAWEDANKAVEDQVKIVQDLRAEIAKIDDEIANVRKEFQKEWGSMDSSQVGGEQMTEMAKEAAEQFLKIKEDIAEIEKNPSAGRSGDDQEKLVKLRAELAAGEAALSKSKVIDTQKALQLEQQLFQIQAERRGMELEDRAGMKDQAGINARLQQEKDIQAEIQKIRNPQAGTFEEAFGFQVQKQDAAAGGSFLEQLQMKFEEEKAERLRQAQERIADEELKKEHLMNELTTEREHLVNLQTERDKAHTTYIATLGRNQAQVEKLINEHATRVIAQYAAIEAAAKRAYSAGGISAPAGGGGGGGTGFASGGFTGGTAGQPRGIVHGEEWVAPAWMTKRYGGLFGYLEGMRKGVRGYAKGGFVGNQPSGGVTNNNRVEINVPTTVEDPNDLRTVLEEAGFMLTRRLSA